MWNHPGPGIEPVSLQWQADNYLLYHQGRPRVIFSNMLSIVALLSSGRAMLPFCPRALRGRCSSLPQTCNSVLHLCYCTYAPFVVLTPISLLMHLLLCPVRRLNSTRPLRPVAILHFLRKTFSTYQAGFPCCDPQWWWFELITRDSITLSCSVSLIYELEGSTLWWQTRLCAFFFCFIHSWCSGKNSASRAWECVEYLTFKNLLAGKNWVSYSDISEPGFFFWKTWTVILISRPVGLLLRWLKESGT